MSESVPDIKGLTTEILAAAEVVARAHTAGGEAQKAGGEAQKTIATKQADLTVALHAQTEQRVDLATTNINGQTKTLINEAAKLLNDSTQKAIKEATDPLSTSLATLIETVTKMAESNTKIVNSLTQGQTDLKQQVANLTTVANGLSTAHQQLLAWQQPQYPQYPQYPQTDYSQYQYPPTDYSQTPTFGGATSSTPASSLTLSNPSPQDLKPHAEVLAQMAVAVAEGTRHYSAKSVTADYAALERTTMEKHLGNLETALTSHGAASDLALQLIGGNQVPNVKLTDWEQELAGTFIAGTTYSKPPITGLDLVKAYRRLTFPAADTMGSAVGHDNNLWTAWASAVNAGWKDGRETTLLTHVQGNERTTYITTSGGDGAIYAWDGSSGWYPVGQAPAPGAFQSFLVAAPKQDTAHERSKDGDKALLEYLFQIYEGHVGGTIEMVTSIGMCGSCVMVAVQMLHRCPDLKINVRVTYFPPNYGGKAAFFNLKDAGTILMKSLQTASSTSDGGQLLKKQRTGSSSTNPNQH